MANSPDIWNAVNGLNQQGYEAALGAVPAHQTHPGGYGNMEAAHAHMVRLPSLLPSLPSIPGSPEVKTGFPSHPLQDSYSPHSVLASDVSRGLPPMSTFHRNNVAPRTSENSTSEKNKHIYLFSGCFLRPVLHVACCLCLFQSRGATEMRPEGHRRATPWAKLWPR